jgi:Asp-tRNA(Asn)/Glu-tRNA(Gln) amidotransferase A subunit family amidase
MTRKPTQQEIDQAAAALRDAGATYSDEEMPRHAERVAEATNILNERLAEEAAQQQRQPERGAS